jgi:hypothetical protein
LLSRHHDRLLVVADLLPLSEQTQAAKGMRCPTTAVLRAHVAFIAPSGGGERRGGEEGAAAV